MHWSTVYWLSIGCCMWSSTAGVQAPSRCLLYSTQTWVAGGVQTQSVTQSVSDPVSQSVALSVMASVDSRQVQRPRPRPRPRGRRGRWGGRHGQAQSHELGGPRVPYGVETCTQHQSRETLRSEEGLAMLRYLGL